MQCETGTRTCTYQTLGLTKFNFNLYTMKTIKAAYFGGNCQGGTMGYTIGKKDYEVTGEFYYNKSKDRIEHIHEGVRGGQYLIIW